MYQPESESKLMASSCEISSKEINTEIENNAVSSHVREYVSFGRIDETVKFRSPGDCHDNTSNTVKEIKNDKSCPHCVDNFSNTNAVNDGNSVVLDKILPSLEDQYGQCSENGCDIFPKTGQGDVLELSNVCSTDALNSPVKECLEMAVSLHFKDANVNTNMHIKEGEDTICSEVDPNPETHSLETRLPTTNIPESFTTNNQSQHTNHEESSDISKKSDHDSKLHEIPVPTILGSCNSSNSVDTREKGSVPENIDVGTDTREIAGTDSPGSLKASDGEECVINGKSGLILKIDTETVLKNTILNVSASSIPRSSLGKCTITNETDSIPKMVDVENTIPDFPMLVTNKASCSKFNYSIADIANDSAPEIINRKNKNSNISAFIKDDPSRSRTPESVLEEMVFITSEKDSGNLIVSKSSVESGTHTELYSNCKLTHRISGETKNMSDGRVLTESKTENSRNYENTTQKPIEKSDVFISDDPCENYDNDNPEWELLKKLATDEERYKAVRSRWRNLSIPDPNRNLTRIHIKYCFKHPRISFKNKLDENKVTSRKRTLSYDSSVPDHAPVKRARTRSCTTSYDLKVQNHKRMVEEEERKLILEKEKALVQSKSEFNKEWGRLMSSQLKYYNYSEFQTRLSILHNNQKQVVDDLNRQFSGALHKLANEDRKKKSMFENSMREVEAFHKFYRKLDEEKSTNDCFFLTETELDDVFETDKLYEKFNTFYS